MEAFGLLMHGFAVLLTWKTLLLMMLGLVLGIFVGVLPGLGGPNGVAILLPLTFTMDPTSAIVMLSCIYWGALFGGAITSILFNIPGEAWSVATTFDGYPMAQQGRAAEALTAAFTSSFIGSLVAVLLITFLAPMISSFALKFGPPEFFAVYLLDLLLLCRARPRGQAQDGHFDVARPAARRHRHGHRVRPVAHDLRFGGTVARRQLPGRRDRPVRHQRNPADHGRAPGAARPCRRHLPARGAVGLEGPAEILGDAAALLLHRLLARHHPGRRDRRVLHGLQPRQALLQGPGQFWQGPHRGRVRAGNRGARLRHRGAAADAGARHSRLRHRGDPARRA